MRFWLVSRGPVSSSGQPRTQQYELSDDELVVGFAGWLLKHHYPEWSHESLLAQYITAEDGLNSSFEERVIQSFQRRRRESIARACLAAETSRKASRSKVLDELAEFGTRSADSAVVMARPDLMTGYTRIGVRAALHALESNGWIRFTPPDEYARYVVSPTEG
jgi:hypothetical protein